MLSPKSVFITGCQRGIGLELVKQFLALSKPPQHLFASCLDPACDEAKELRDIAAANSTVNLLKVDVSNDQDIGEAVTRTEQVVGEEGLNLLINNAGFHSKVAGAAAITRDDLVKHFNCNAAGPMVMSKSFLPLLTKAANKEPSSSLSCNRAAIVNVSTGISSVSFCIKNMQHPWYGYICSKASLTMATNMMGRELCKEGILVAAVNPGRVRSLMGGLDAPVTVEECVGNFLKTFASFNESSVGLLHTNSGDIIPW